MCLVFFSSCAQYSLFCVLGVLTMICHGEILLLFCRFGNLCVSYIYIGVSFSIFIYDLLKKFSRPLPQAYSPSSIFMGHGSFHDVPHFLYVPFLYSFLICCLLSIFCLDTLLSQSVLLSYLLFDSFDLRFLIGFRIFQTHLPFNLSSLP